LSDDDFIKILEASSNERLIFSSIYKLSQISRTFSKNNRERIRSRLKILHLEGRFATLAGYSARANDVFILSRNTSRLHPLLYECWQGLKDLGSKVKRGFVKSSKS